MKTYNPIKAEEKIMNEPLTKDEQKFVDSFTLDKMITYEDIKVVISLKVRCNKEVRKYLNDYITQQEKLQDEHEALKKDVARYLELQQKFENANFSFVKEQDKQEYFRLNQKLSKVGKEE